MEPLEPETIKELPNSLNEILDDFTKKTNDIFSQLSIAYQVIIGKEFGGKDVDQFNDDVIFNLASVGNFTFEPIEMKHVKEFKRDNPEFLMETFHGKLVQAWNDCLINIFSFFVFSHFEGEKTFTTLGKKYKVVLDFTLSNDDFIKQIPQSTVNEFTSIREYSDRLRYVRDIFNSEGIQNYLDEVDKNIKIRNNIQHNNSKVGSNLRNKKMFDIYGNLYCCEIDKKITFSFFDIKSFINAMQSVVKKWSEDYEKQKS